MSDHRCPECNATCRCDLGTRIHPLLCEHPCDEPFVPALAPPHLSATPDRRTRCPECTTELTATQDEQHHCPTCKEIVEPVPITDEDHAS